MSTRFRWIHVLWLAVIVASLVLIADGLLRRRSLDRPPVQPVLEPSDGELRGRTTGEESDVSGSSESRASELREPMRSSPADAGMSRAELLAGLFEGREMRQGAAELDLSLGGSHPVINEIYLESSTGLPKDQWIEIHNPTERAVDLSGWKLRGPVSWTGARGSTLAPGGYLLLSVDPSHTRAALGIPSTTESSPTGAWLGELGIEGTLELFNAKGRSVDRVVYGGASPFSRHTPGSSLERLNPARPGDLSRNWAVGGGSSWVRVQLEGRATSDRLYLYLEGVGSARIDGLSCSRLSDKRELLRGQSATVKAFFEGNHARSKLRADGGVDDGPCLEVTSTGIGRSRGSSVTLAGLPIRGQGMVRISFWVRFPDHGAAPLIARLSQSQEGQGIWGRVRATRATPGRLNARSSKLLATEIYPVMHSPVRPPPDTDVELRARVQSDSPILDVVLKLQPHGGASREISMTSQAAGESDASTMGGEEFVASLGSFPDGSLVHYSIHAKTSAGEARFPPLNAESLATTQSFYVGKNAVEDLPVLRLFMDPSDLSNLQRSVHSDVYHRVTVVHDGQTFDGAGIRYRGQTSRSYPKRHLKVKLRNAHQLGLSPGSFPMKTINLQACYADKTFLRDILAYRLWRDLGEAHCATEPVVVELNGSFYGLFVRLENPGSGYMLRNRLDGRLWKAYSTAQGPGGRYELEAGEVVGARVLLDEFLRELNSASGEELESVIRKRIRRESLTRYLAAIQLVHNADHVQKNYLIHADSNAQFTFLPWDLDLSHGRNYECYTSDRFGRRGLLNDVMRHDMWDEDSSDRKLLFGTSSHPKCDGLVNGVIDVLLKRSSSFKQDYYQQIAYGLRHFYHPEILIPKVRRLAEPLRPWVQKDRERWGSYGGDEDHASRCAALEAWIRKRHEYLVRRLASLGVDVGSPINACFDRDKPAGPVPHEVQFENLSYGDEIESYHWDFGDGETSTSKDPRHRYNRPGRYDVTLKVTDKSGEHSWTFRDAVVGH